MSFSDSEKEEDDEGEDGGPDETCFDVVDEEVGEEGAESTAVGKGRVSWVIVIEGGTEGERERLGFGMGKRAGRTGSRRIR